MYSLDDWYFFRPRKTWAQPDAAAISLRKSRTRPSCTRERVTCSQNAHVVHVDPRVSHTDRVDMLSNTHTYIRARCSPKQALSSLLDVLSARRGDGSCALCEITRSCGAAARSSFRPEKVSRKGPERPKFWPRKKTRIRAISFHRTRLTFSRMFFPFSAETPAIYGLLTEALLWKILYVGRQYPAGKVLIYER